MSYIVEDQNQVVEGHLVNISPRELDAIKPFNFILVVFLYLSSLKFYFQIPSAILGSF